MGPGITAPLNSPGSGRFRRRSRSSGRFFGHALKGRDLEQGLRAPLRRTWLETDAQAEVVELRITDGHERLRALVDGEWSHRFRG